MAWGDTAAVGKLIASLLTTGDGGWQTKGSGKWANNKGKGKGKGKGGDATQSDDSCFQCMWAGCTAAEEQKVTWGGKPCCHSCGRHKGIAKSPPLEQLVAWAYEKRCKLAQAKGNGKGQPSPSDNGKNKAATTPPPRTPAAVVDQERLAELRAERVAGLKGAPPVSSATSGAAASSPAAQQQGAPKAQGKKEGSVLCQSAIESAPLLKDLLQPIIDLVAADWVAIVPTGLDPEEGLKTLLQGSGHLSAADGREALEACLAESRKLLGTATSPTLRKCLEAQIAVDAAELEKRAKLTSPSLATQLAALQEAEKSLLTQTSNRKDKESRGKDKALERGNARREHFADVRSQLAIMEAAVESHEAQWSSIHEAKSQVLDYHGVAMLAKLHTRIAAAEKPADPTVTAQTGAQTPPPEAARDVEMKTLKDSLSASEAVAKSAADAVAQAKATAEAAATEASSTQTVLLKRIEALQASAQQAELLQKQALATQQAELVFAEADFSMIPQDVAPKTGEKAFWKVCGHLYQMLERWHYGGTIAVTLAELSAHSLAKDTTQALMLKLLGPQLWQGWFGQSDFRMADDSVLPRQTLMFLYYALQQMKDHYEGVEDTRAAAAKSYTSMVEANSKKRRTLA